jgi:DNA-binding NarL/FixJ family response regulator
MDEGQTTARQTRRIGVVDDHPIILEGMKHLLSTQEALEICAVASTPEEALQMLATNELDLVVVDISLGEVCAVDLIRQIVKHYTSLPVLVLSMHDDFASVKRAIQAGARGFVSKQEATRALTEGICRVLAGELYMSPRVTQRLVEEEAPAPAPPGAAVVAALTPRELEVFALVGQGMSNREIAASLAVEPRTISAHRDNIKRKLHLRHSSEVVAQAARWIESRNP